ncbi:hypothetical protein NSQ55_21310 [Paenibacillus sp. FSL H7-0943]|uniref:hypothetical protein n=1 Tax=Paenibacillus sp. FSL H7-0943 TaxID=2954739 RepID=UPI0030CCF2FD
MSKPFNLFIVDNDEKLFNVIVNISNDDFHNELLVKAQASGRDVRAFSSKDILQNAIKNYADKMDYTYTKDSVL